MLALQQQAAMMQAAQLNAALDSAPPAQEHAPPRDAGAAACGYAQRAWSQDMGFEAARLLLWEASNRSAPAQP